MTQNEARDSLKVALLGAGLLYADVARLRDDPQDMPDGVNVWIPPDVRVPHDTVWIHEDGTYVYGPNFEYRSVHPQNVADHYAALFDGMERQ